MHYTDCIVVAGEALVPHRCAHVAIEDGRISRLDLVAPVQQIDDGAIVLLPGLVNAHTHVGDSFLPDGATGLTLEQGFFRPDGLKYRELAKLDRSTHVAAIVETLTYMKASGTVAHFDFREQGPEGASRLSEAAGVTGVRSVVLGQFDHVPFDDRALAENTAALSAPSLAELDALLEIADGFSESTMNDLTDTAWRQIRERTGTRSRARAIHCLENEGYRDVSLARTGRGDLEQALDLYAPDLVVHMTVANDTEIRLLADAGITAVVNPRANANLGLPLPPVARLLDAGVNLLLGTDNGLLNSPNLFAELDFTYKLVKSQIGNAIDPDPAAILAMATANVARTRWGGELPGRLELGGPATFVELDFHRPHLKRSRHLVASILTRVTPADVVRTVRDGSVIHDRVEDGSTAP